MSRGTAHEAGSISPILKGLVVGFAGALIVPRALNQVTAALAQRLQSEMIELPGRKLKITQVPDHTTVVLSRSELGAGTEEQWVTVTDTPQSIIPRVQGINNLRTDPWTRPAQHRLLPVGAR